MVVDDEWLNRELLEGVLTAIGYRALLVGTSEDAIPQANEYNPGLIIVDVRMPRMNGYEVCRLLRQQPSTENTPILLISGLNAGSEERKQADEVGANGIIDRSTGVEKLAALIQSFFPND